MAARMVRGGGESEERSEAERRERLEQLRALEHGMDIRVADAVVLPGPDVNTLDDIARVVTQLSANAERHE